MPNPFHGFGPASRVDSKPCSPLGVELSATHLDSRRTSIGKLEREEGICLHWPPLVVKCEHWTSKEGAIFPFPKKKRLGILVVFIGIHFNEILFSSWHKLIRIASLCIFPRLQDKRMITCQFNDNWLDDYWCSGSKCVYIINVGVWTSLAEHRLISRALKLTTM